MLAVGCSHILGVIQPDLFLQTLGIFGKPSMANVALHWDASHVCMGSTSINHRNLKFTDKVIHRRNNNIFAREQSKLRAMLESCQLSSSFALVFTVDGSACLMHWVASWQWNNRMHCVFWAGWSAGINYQFVGSCLLIIDATFCLHGTMGSGRSL